jgi:type III pantothenate kinase
LKAESIWLGLIIGNSRLHWAGFSGETFQSWDTNHLPAEMVEQIINGLSCNLFEEIFPQSWVKALQDSAISSQIQLYIASVVPAQAALWQEYPGAKIITLDQIPLKKLYPTLGIDRALAVWGVGTSWGWPILVIDAGTALTFTGANVDRELVGGAILPGLGLQFQSLSQQTAALPKINLPPELPPRWANNTVAAISSGIVYTILAGVENFITAWWQEFPNSKIVLTGGDRHSIKTYLNSQNPELAAKIVCDADVSFKGMQAIVIADGKFYNS